MIFNTVPYDYLRVRVKDKTAFPSVYTEIMANGNEIQIQRGGTVGVLGLDSVNAGTMSMTIYNALDPAVISTLSPGMLISVYSTQFATPGLGAIYTGKIVDINSSYFMNTRDFDIDTYVTITAVDAVQSHANVTVPGVTTTAGFERWEERIATLAPYALTQVQLPAINTNTVIDSF
jgi:hypothetical protein